MKATHCRDDRRDNNSIFLTAEIIPPLSLQLYDTSKHLIFAQLLICALLFKSSLFTFPADQFTCCCWAYPARRACRFLLLKQLLCSVCFEFRQDSIKESLNIFCLTLPTLCACALTEAVKPDACKSCFVLSVYLTCSCQVKEQTVTPLCPACATVDLPLAPQPECVWIASPRAQR